MYFRSIAALALLVPFTAHAGDLALRKVMLSSAGVGYFEYAADVDGATTLGLDVPLDQVDDVLKSLVVFDDAGGVGGIELPGRDQTNQAFGDVPFGPEALGSPLAFLNSLQGVEVVVQGPRPMTGKIMQAETVRAPPGKDGAPAPDQTRVSVLTTDGLKQFVLEDSDAVQVADPELRGGIDRALAALRQASRANVRHLTIRASGAGHRTVRVGYVAVAPLWKVSYRLVLPPADADPAQSKARLQGWATLENTSAADWSGVALSLQYGNPVTFHQAIYRSYFVERPEVPVEVLGRILPDVDRQAVAAKSDAAEVPRGMALRAMPGGFAQAAPAPAPAMPEAQLARPAEPAAAQEGTEDTVFTIARPVDLAAGHSASVPILDRDVPGERVWLARIGDAHPLAAIRVKNDADQSLPAGVLTLYDQGAAPYAGDARLGGLPVGDTRLVSFAQDLRTDLAFRPVQQRTVSAIHAAKGLLTIESRLRETTQVTLTAPLREPRRVLLELPKRGDARVAADLPQPGEETATAWRFMVELKPGQTERLTLGTERAERRVVTLLDKLDTIAAIVADDGTSAPVRTALQRIADLRAQEASLANDRAMLAAQRDAVEKNEERLRANIAAVPAGDALRSRLTQQLGADETRLAQLATQIEAADAAVAKAHQALADAVATLSL